MANNTKRGAANIRMHRAIKKIAQGTPVSVAMRESGYSAPYSKNPQYLVRTEAFQRMLHDNGLALDDVTKVHRKLLQSKREEIAQRAVDTAYKVHGVYDRQRSTQSTTPIQIVINPPQVGTIRTVDGVEVLRQTGGEDSTPIAP
jgi:hypothetical protein